MVGNQVIYSSFSISAINWFSAKLAGNLSFSFYLYSLGPKSVVANTENIYFPKKEAVTFDQANPSLILGEYICNDFFNDSCKKDIFLAY